MQTTTKQWDVYQNEPVTQYSIENHHGVKLAVLSWGATLHRLTVPTAHGDHNLVLSYHKMAHYLDNPFYVGMSIGRTGGRLTKGQFTLGQTTYHVDQNEGQNTLHGGPHGFNTVNWTGQIINDDPDLAKIVLKHTFKQTDDSYPGDLHAQITYTLDNYDRVTITFNGDATAATLFNPTAHVYFNLGDDQLITGQTLQVNGHERLELDEEKLPTGRFLTTNRTPYDLANGQNLGVLLRGLQDVAERGLDDVYHVQPANDGTIAELYDPQSKRRLSIKSSRNGLVVFTANSFTSQLKLANGVGQPYMGVALEPQTLPDSPNHPHLGDVTLPAHQTQEYTIGYELTF